MQPKYPNTPTAAERKRQAIQRAKDTAAAILLTAAALAYFAIVFITLN